MTFWSARRVWLTGGGGFLGSHLRERIARERPEALFAPRATEVDLRDRQAIEDHFAKTGADFVIHAAAVVGGIGANRARPGQFFYENAVMGLHLIEEARRASVKKFVCLGTVCAYPKFTPVPFRETSLWDGYPEETNAPYGLAKKMLLVQLQAYRQEYGFSGIYVLPANLYGPGDHFDLQTSHVIPAIVRKLVDAQERGEREVVLWGDGTPTREFLYVTDAADGIVAAAERYESAEPVNLGTSQSITIAELAALIAELTGYGGRIVWDPRQPAGQPRRQLDVTRARESFGFEARVPLVEGLRRTIAWYRERRPVS